MTLNQKKFAQLKACLLQSCRMYQSLFICNEIIEEIAEFITGKRIICKTCGNNTFLRPCGKCENILINICIKCQGNQNTSNYSCGEDICKHCIISKISNCNNYTNCGTKYCKECCNNKCVSCLNMFCDECLQICNGIEDEDGCGSMVCEDCVRWRSVYGWCRYNAYVCNYCVIDVLSQKIAEEDYMDEHDAQKRKQQCQSNKKK
eukprot:439810_1